MLLKEFNVAVTEKDGSLFPLMCCDNRESAEACLKEVRNNHTEAHVGIYTYDELITYKISDKSGRGQFFLSSHTLDDGSKNVITTDGWLVSNIYSATPKWTFIGKHDHN